MIEIALKGVNDEVTSRTPDGLEKQYKLFYEKKLNALYYQALGITTSGIGQFQGGNTGITLRSGTSSTGSKIFSDATSGTSQYDGYLEYHHAHNRFIIATNSVEKVRIDKDGNTNIVGIITASNFDYFDRGDYQSNIKLGHDVGNANLVSNGAQFNILIGYRTGYALTSGDNAVMIGIPARNEATTSEEIKPYAVTEDSKENNNEK